MLSFVSEGQASHIIQEPLRSSQTVRQTAEGAVVKRGINRGV